MSVRQAPLSEVRAARHEPVAVRYRSQQLGEVLMCHGHVAVGSEAQPEIIRTGVPDRDRSGSPTATDMLQAPLPTDTQGQ